MPFWEDQQSLTVLGWIARVTVTYLWLLFITKLMGQREVGRLTLFDFVISITIGSISASPLSSSSQNLIPALISITVLGTLHITFAYIALKNAKFRRIVQEEPLVLIQNGTILEDTLRKARYNLDDLLSELRLKNVPDPADVEFAILEPTGRLSVVPKSQARPVLPRDLQLSTAYEGLPSVLIEDGNVLQDNLNENKLSEDWLREELENLGITDPNAVMIAVLNTRGQLYVSKKGQSNDEWVH